MMVISVVAKPTRPAIIPNKMSKISFKIINDEISSFFNIKWKAHGKTNARSELPIEPDIAAI